MSRTVAEISSVVTLAILLLIGGLGSAMAASDPPSRVESQPRNQTDESNTESLAVVRFTIPPWQKDKRIDQIHDLYKPMLDWLGEKVGCRFVFVSSRSYDEAIENLATGRVEMASLSPVPYVLCKRRNPEVNLLVTSLQPSDDGKSQTDSYMGHIVTLKSRTDIESIQDLKGKRFGFVKPESSSGFKYPNALLRKQGIDYTTFFSETYFLGSHPRVTDAIVSGSIAAGATWDFNLRQAVAKHGEVFKSILQTPPIPNLCMAAHPNLSQDLQTKIAEWLPKIDPALLKDTPASGFVVREDSFYDVVRTVIDASTEADQ